VSGRLYLGTSGFSYAQWKGAFYPTRIPQRDMLAFYGQRFNSVELNYSFRKQPTAENFAAWREAAPEGFVFAVKAPQRITHWLRLRDAGEAVAEFVLEASRLEAKLGPVLFQCPPNLKFDRDLAQTFLAVLPPGRRYAFEFRHPSWLEARPLLVGGGGAWCVADTEERPAPDEPLPGWPFAYLRLRRRRYTKRDLERWAGRISATLESGNDVFCYFKHEEQAAGPRFASRLAALIPT
jgi:uncharacterized protein YecE (DUF72 family)